MTGPSSLVEAPATPDRGVRRRCADCGSPFYDLRRDPIVCPKCGTTHVPTTWSKRTRMRPTPTGVEVVPVVADVVEASEEGASEEGASEEEAGEGNAGDGDARDGDAEDDAESEADADTEADDTGDWGDAEAGDRDDAQDGDADGAKHDS